jgi:hypothetical protein
MNDKRGSNPRAGNQLTNMDREYEYEIIRLIALLRYREQLLLTRKVLNVINFNIDKHPCDWILEF